MRIFFVRFVTYGFDGKEVRCKKSESGESPIKRLY